MHAKQNNVYKNQQDVVWKLLKEVKKFGIIEGYKRGYDDGYNDAMETVKSAISDGTRKGSGQCGRELNRYKKNR